MNLKGTKGKHVLTGSLCIYEIEVKFYYVVIDKQKTSMLMKISRLMEMDIEKGFNLDLKFPVDWVY